jgi:mRNA-degrading endonuclease RelE of RelBE toxin-antitoxin system
MSYELLFHPDALDEWGELDKALREQFKKKLAERLLDPMSQRRGSRATGSATRSSSGPLVAVWSTRCGMPS